MLDTALKAQLQAYLERLTRPVQLVATLDASEDAQRMRTFLHEVASVSERVTLVESDLPNVRRPSFAVTSEELSISLRFAAIPLGHEFTSLVLALLQVGGHPLKVDPAVIEQIRALDGDYTFEAFVSLSCQNCPDVVQALNVMALINPKIRATTIDGGLFQDEVEAKRIMAVPTVYLNGEVFDQGRMSLEQIVAKLDRSSGERQAQALAAKAPFDVLIVGGGPAAAAAAIYAARKGVRTGVVAERFGGQVLDTMSIENFVSVPGTEGPTFAAALENHVKQHDVDVMDLQRAQTLRTTHEGFAVDLASGATLTSKTVIVATGARWREMNVPGEQEYRNRGVAYCPHCDGPLFKGKRVAVVGGGNSGVEAAIDLAGIVKHVTLLEYGDALRADAVLQAKVRSLPNVTVITQAQTTEVMGDGEKVQGLRFTDRRNGESRALDLEGIFVQIGLVPNAEWLTGTLALSARGEVEVDAKGQTSIPGVFAAGDVTTAPYKQIVIAVGEGAKASLAAFEHLIRLPVVEERQAA